MFGQFHSCDERSIDVCRSELRQDIQVVELTSFLQASHDYLRLVAPHQTCDQIERISHCPSGVAHAGKTVSSWSVSPSCYVSKLFGFHQLHCVSHSYCVSCYFLCGGDPPQEIFTGKSLQCSHRYVKIIVLYSSASRPDPSVTPANRQTNTHQDRMKPEEGYSSASRSRDTGSPCRPT